MPGVDNPKATMHHLLQTLFLLTLIAFAPAVHATTVVINEFQASNSETIADEDGDFEDWIELYNYGDAPVLLGGYGLSDDAENPFRWVLPDISLGPGEFLLVFASNKDRTGGPFLHTNYAISAAGEEVLLTAPDGALLDFVPPTPIPTDVSYGRQPDGTGDWFFFEVPTPGTGNAEEGYLGVLDPPALSHEGGFYEEAFSLTGTHNDPHATIRYTDDGTDPTEQSASLATSIQIDDRTAKPDVLAPIPTSTPQWWNKPKGPYFKGTAIRMRAFRPGWLPSRTTTATYFVTPEGGERFALPAVSIVTPPDGFFNPDHGIYVLGNSYDDENELTANFHQRGRDWERPAHFEFFSTAGELEIAQDLGVRIHGGATRIFPLKSLRLYARNAYSDQNTIDFPFFPEARMADGSVQSEFRRLIMRNSGNDTRRTMIRDAFMQSLLLDLERIETQPALPVVTFLNGEFWGMLNLRTRYDAHYFHMKYGLDPARIAILMNNAWLEHGSPTDQDDYWDMRAYAAENDLAVQAYYEHVASQMDVISYIDCFLAHIYFHNTDWPHNNLRFWRFHDDGEDDAAPEQWWRDGRWRWIVFDTDFGFHGFGPTRADSNAEFLDNFESEFGPLGGPAANTLRWATAEINGHNLQAWPNELFLALLDNEAFRKQFINRAADHLNTRFREPVVAQKLQSFRSTIEPVVEEHFGRWIHGNGNIVAWHQDLDRMAAFAHHRPGYMRQHIIDYFGLEGTYELTIAMPPEGSARVRVNSIELEANGEEWTGTYFLGVPIEVEVIPQSGHEFVDWDGAFSGEGTALSLNPGSDTALAPILEQGTVSLHEVILPRFMQGESPDNNDRVPFSSRLRIEGLLPNALYRYANRVVTADDPPTQNGAGNAIYHDLATDSHFRTTATPDFAEPGTYGEFITDETGAYEGWFTLEPSGNQRFAEPELFIRVLLNDGLGGEEYHHFLTTPSTVSILPFGFGWEQATGVYATSAMTPGNVVVLHDDPEGMGRPLSATLVEAAGFEVDGRYAAFYEQFVSGQDGHFGSLLPNLLPGGLARIEEFAWDTAESMAVLTSPDGFWPDDADTVNPDGGLGLPLALNLVPAGSGIPGDVNNDGEVNAIDVQLAINAALGIAIGPGLDADINNDGEVNAIDVQLVINAALGIAISP